MYDNTSQRGYIALVSAIVISALLLIIAVSLGIDGFFERSDILDTESKELSRALAEACVNEAIFEAAAGVYATNKTITVGSHTCLIVSVQKNIPVAGQNFINTQAVINKAATNLGVAVDAVSHKITSWKECAASPCL